MNRRLKNVFKLSSRITLYVPATKNVNEEFDNAEYVDRAAVLFSELFGGSTSTPALGYWLSPTKGLVKENTALVFTYCNEEDLNRHIDKLVDFCEQLKTELSQESVALEINGEMYFV